MAKPEILENKILARTKLFQIEGIHLRFANGQERHFERIKGSSVEAVMVIPMLDNETVLLIREYGAGLGDYYLGLPKGAAGKDEDILVAANRELMEETGYGAKELLLLKPLSSSPAYNARKMSLVLARDLYEQRLPGDEPEEIEVIPWSLNNLDQLLSREDFHEARSIAALYIVRDFLNASR